MFGGLGTTEILIIVGILILLFGAKQIPKIAKSIEQSRREFRRALNKVGDIHAEDADKSVVRR